MAQRMGLYLQDKHDIKYELQIAQYAEEKGFSEIWQADTRLARDCIVMMSALLTHTTRIKIGRGYCQFTHVIRRLLRLHGAPCGNWRV
ncbi:MAG: hypothetical protein CM15mP49_29580 [Actinomycetota bacterium]|nr:MAG: hypothetical protein CM15mP49_29580 [Actinomycetota bacterium]